MNVTILSMPVHHSIDYPGMSTMPPTAIYLLGTILKKEGYEVDIIDPYNFRELNPIDNATDEKLLNFLKEKLFHADVVCLSSNTLNWSMTKVACSAIRNLYPHIMIVAGGLHPTYFDEYLMKTNPIDFILRGDGEKSIIELMHVIKTTKEYDTINGLTWRNGSKVVRNPDVLPLCRDEIMNIPLPEFKNVQNQIYSIMPIATSNGCKYACRFCSIPHKHEWIGYPGDWAAYRIIESIEKYGDRFNTKCIYIVDDCFTADNKRAIEILKKILKAEKDLQIILEARASDLKEDELLELLQAPEIIRVAVGVECGYNEGLKRINKGLTIELLENRIEKFQQYDLMKKMFFSFIIGFPWEQAQDYKLTMDYAASIVERFGYPNVNINWLNLFPSYIWENRRKFGIMVDEDIFDVHGMIKNSRIFKATHPRVDEFTQRFVDRYVKSYKINGISLING